MSDCELEKVKNKLESVQTFDNISYQRVAYKLAWFELAEKAERINEEPLRYRAVDSSCIKRLSGEMFSADNASVLYYQNDGVA